MNHLVVGKLYNLGSRQTLYAYIVDVAREYLIPGVLEANTMLVYLGCINLTVNYPTEFSFGHGKPLWAIRVLVPDGTTGWIRLWETEFADLTAAKE